MAMQSQLNDRMNARIGEKGEAFQDFTQRVWGRYRRALAVAGQADELAGNLMP
jgi:hypothetical protein